jgi:nucleoside-diphosphate-sugar epimerase
MGSILMETKGVILVTGCSGLVGTHLCNKLEDYGYSVIGVDIKYSDALPNSDRFIFHNIDLR